MSPRKATSSSSPFYDHEFVDQKARPRTVTALGRHIEVLTDSLEVAQDLLEALRAQNTILAEENAMLWRRLQDDEGTP